jgi:methionine--tRNA ligase beta chain
MEFEEDPRSAEIPDPPVSSLEELKAQQSSKISTSEPEAVKTLTTASKPDFSGLTCGDLIDFDDLLTARIPNHSSEEIKAQQSSKVSANEPKAAKTVTTSDGPTSASMSDSIDISKLDIRVGVITKAWLHEEADSLFCEEIDVGEGEPRQIASGLRAYYNVEDLVGQRVLVLANLKARKLVGFASHGMVLCASKDDKVVFVEPPEGAQVGERVMVEGFEGEPATENQVLKKKMLDQIFPDLSTNADGEATYKDVPLRTSAGSCRATLTNAKVA